LKLYPTSGTAGTYLNMDSSAITVASASTTTASFRISARDPGGQTIATSGMANLGGILDVAASINPSTGAVNGQSARLTATGSWTSVSDARLKKGVHKADGLLAKVLKLRPVWFRYKSEADTAPESMGFIAQEVDKQLPCFVDHGPDRLSLNYAGLSTVAIGAVQEQQTLIEQQNARIQKLEADNAALQQRLERLEKAMTSVAAK